MSKLVVILGSSRPDSRTRELLTDVLSDQEYSLIDLREWRIDPYSYRGSYSGSDRFHQLINEVLQADRIIFATPVYWYSMSALLKQFFDRFTDLVTIKKEKGRMLKGKKVFLIASGTDPDLPDGFEVPFNRTSTYLDMDYVGCVYQSTDTGNRFGLEKLDHFLK